MKKVLCILFCILLAGCGQTPAERTESGMYQQITAEEAKQIMDSGAEIIILDVREQEEFDAGHIPNAVLLPYTQMNEQAARVLPDKNAQILVYCRSGRRSKIAAEALAALGYTRVYEFGGILDWKYEIERSV